MSGLVARQFACIRCRRCMMEFAGPSIMRLSGNLMFSSRRLRVLLALCAVAICIFCAYSAFGVLLRDIGTQSLDVYPAAHLADSAVSRWHPTQGACETCDELIDSFFTEEQLAWLDHYRQRNRSVDHLRSSSKDALRDVREGSSHRTNRSGGAHRLTGSHPGNLARSAEPLLAMQEPNDGRPSGTKHAAREPRHAGDADPVGSQPGQRSSAQRSAGIMASAIELVDTAGLGHWGRAESSTDLLPGQAMELPADAARPSAVETAPLRVALRSAHGTWLSAAMDAERVLQARFLGHSELFELMSVGAAAGGASVGHRVQLRARTGRCVSVWYDGSVHQNTKCSAWETFTLLVAAADRVLLRTAHASFLSAHDNARSLGHAPQHGDAEQWTMVALRLPLEPVSGFDDTIVVHASWRHRGAWCIQWLDGTPTSSSVHAEGGESCIARLCFNATSRTEYLEVRSGVYTAAPAISHAVAEEAAAVIKGALPASVFGQQYLDVAAQQERALERIGERPLCIRANSPFELLVAMEKGVLSYALTRGCKCDRGWRSLVAPLTRLQLQSARVQLRSDGAALLGARLSANATASLRLAAPFEMPSMRKLQVSGAPQAFVEAQGERGAPRFRLYNPSLVHAHGNTVQVVAKVSSYHLCGASDDYFSRAKDASAELLSFAVAFDARLDTGALAGGVRALAAVNARLTRHTQWGDGPEDPRAVRVKGQEVLLLWARAWKPEYAVYAAIGDTVTRLKQVGCEACAQKNWVPFAHRGELLVEQSIEPRVVLRVDVQSGRATPIANGTSLAAASALQAALGASLHGGPPSLRVRLPHGKQAFLGLAHLNRLLGGKSALRIYYHVFYLFAARPPFELLAIGRPFMFPSEIALVQFASGMLLVDEQTLLISFGEQDCDARRAHVPLALALADVLIAEGARAKPRPGRAAKHQNRSRTARGIRR